MAFNEAAYIGTGVVISSDGLDGRVRPLPAGAEIEYMGERATVVADNGGASLLVESDGIRQEWMWEFDGTPCVLISMSNSGAAVPFSRWAPIATAPLDGSRILLYRAGFAEDAAVCWWSAEAKAWIPVEGVLFCEATHWMPVPERPNVELSGRQRPATERTT